jgi:hypothetical protein
MPEAWSLTTAGLHVPVMPLVDTEGKIGIGPPAQIVSECAKAKGGCYLGVTVTVKVVGTAHSFAPGVKV